MSIRTSQSRSRGPGAGSLLGRALLLLILGTTLAVPSLRSTPVAHAAGVLTVEIQAAYNLVVDSNVTSPSTRAPGVATVAGRFCNSGDADLADVVGYIGNYTSTASSTSGIYPARNSAGFGGEHPALVDTGYYAFTHPGGSMGTSDATRYIGTLAQGECKVVYWHLTYPQCSNVGSPPVADPPPCSGTPVWGDSIKPDDDLWLQFDVWGSSAQGSNANAT